MAHKPQHARSHRVYQPGKRHMELMPSLSRSSGLDKDGDALRDRTVQEEYRAFIEGKINDFWKRHPYEGNPQDMDMKKRQEEQENILILFRKLREGLLATDRKDAFALEVYETSLYLSILFHSEKQTTSILSHLLPSLYLKRPNVPRTDGTAFHTTLLSLLHHLLAGYPSQSRYHEHLHSLPRVFLPRDGHAYRWLVELTRCLRMSNYARLQGLTDRSAFEHFSVAKEADDRRHALAGRPSDLVLEAMCTLVEGLRAKARSTAWLVVRSAYRELHCVLPATGMQAPRHDEPSPTSEWLARSLALRPLRHTAADVDEAIKAVDEWLLQRSSEGEAKRKEGMEGRWTLYKVPVKT